MDATVESRCGKLRGRFSNGVTAFKGVPFAAPPFGANRLRPPEPVGPWEGVRDAFEFGPKSPQVAYPPGIADALAELVGPGEDCLTLNVWTPEIAAAGRPVMVWIPGGCSSFMPLVRAPSLRRRAVRPRRGGVRDSRLSG